MRLVPLVGALAAALATCVPAIAEVRLPAERWTIPYTGGDINMPACNSETVLSKIQSRFSQTQQSYWNSDRQLVAFDDVHPLGFRTWGLDFIPRLFCTGKVQVSDGRWHRIDFSVVEDGGIIGYTWGVDWCVTGYDLEHAYAPGCKMARP